MERTDGDPEFEWDERKRLKVLNERGIDFRAAARMLLDEPVLETPQERGGELRWLAIGVVDGCGLAVVYVHRGRCRRIITARRANRNERKRYYACFAGGADPPEG